MGGILKMISRADVLAFSCVDKASRAYAEPILYAEIEWTWLRFQQPPHWSIFANYLAQTGVGLLCSKRGS